MAHQEVRGRLDSAVGTSSGPKWPAEPPALPTFFRRWQLIGVGEAAAPIVAEWRKQALSAGAQSEAITVREYSDTASYGLENPALIDDLLGALAPATNGVGVAVAGPEHAVLALERAAHDRGLLASEVVAFSTDRTWLRIYCPHCRARSLHIADAGSIVPCPNCSRRLSVRDHYSRRLTAYLGSDIDAGAIA